MPRILLQLCFIATVFMLSACTSTIRQANYDLYKGRLKAQSYMTGKRYQPRAMMSHSRRYKPRVVRARSVANRQSVVPKAYQRSVINKAKAPYTYHKTQLRSKSVVPQRSRSIVNKFRKKSPPRMISRPPIVNRPYIAPQRRVLVQSRTVPKIPITQLNEQLFNAAKVGNIGQLNSLLEQGAKINAANANRETPLHAAAALGRKVAVSLLLQRGANPNATTSSGWTPLHSAARFSHPQIAKLLVTHGAGINARNNQAKTPVALATQVGANTTVKVLMALGGR